MFVSLFGGSADFQRMLNSKISSLLQQLQLSSAFISQIAFSRELNTRLETQCYRKFLHSVSYIIDINQRTN